MSDATPEEFIARAAPEDAPWRFSERLRSGIASTLGWTDLRDFQKIAVAEVLAGRNCIILAPTAGGKTEAAFFPALDIAFRQSLAPVSCLYISPLRALLNNQEERVSVLSGLVGLRSFKWHGDVSQAQRKRFLNDPADVLLITPESLEVMLLSPNVECAALFQDLRFAIVDEIHAFAGQDRGAHLLSVLERIGEFSAHDVQRIGLSATVGNPLALCEWLQGSSAREYRVVDPPRQPTRRRLAVRQVREGEDAGVVALPTLHGRKALWFVDSRRGVEQMKALLDEHELPAHVHHSSISRAGREEAEATFSVADACCIVCTSTMELGIDVGDLDVVVQLDSPMTVASFLQRLGRTGRRPGTTAHMEFVARTDEAVLLAVSLVRLAGRAWIEPVSLSRRAAHVLVHQILAKVRQHSGVSRGRLHSDLSAPYPFRGITGEEFDRILEHLVATDILHFADGLYTFGGQGERRFAPRNFLELYAVFEAPSLVSVQTRTGEEIGTLETWFVEAMAQQEFIFILAGRKWRAVAVDMERDPGLLTVEPASVGQPPKWMGIPALMGAEVAEEHRWLLLDDDRPPYVLGYAAGRLQAQRQQWREMLLSTRIPLVHDASGVTVHTFAGGRINMALAKTAEILLECEAQMDNFSVLLRRKGVPLTHAEVQVLLEDIAVGGAIRPPLIRQAVANLPRWRLSKFQPYLPPELEAEFLAERLLDFGGLVAVLAS